MDLILSIVTVNSIILHPNKHVHSLYIFLAGSSSHYAHNWMILMVYLTAVAILINQM